MPSAHRSGSPESAPSEVDRKTDIIVRARVIFLAHGIASVSLNKLCRELHVAKKTFYLYFDDKADLVDQMARDTVGRYAVAIQQATRTTSSRIERLEAILEATFQTSAVHSSAVYLRDIAEQYPAVWRRLQKSRRTLARVFVAEVEAGQRGGAFHKDLDPETLMALVDLLLDRVLDPVELARRKLEPVMIAQALVRVFFRGMACPQPDPPCL